MVARVTTTVETELTSAPAARRVARPRVLHIVPALFRAEGGVIGGAERYVFELARHMAAETPTVLLSFGESAERFDDGDLAIRVAGGTRYVRGQRANPFSTEILREVRKADVVHCHQQHIVASSVAAATARLLGKRVFVSDLGGGGWDVSAYVSTDRWFHGHLHISQYSRSVYGHGEKPWAHVIYGGVDTEKFSPDPSVTSDGTVVYVGRILPHKGVDYLVEAVDERTPLEIVGQPYDERFVDDLKRLAEGKRVLFRHGLDDAALVDAYRKALCVVLPSVYETRYGQHSKVPELLGQTLLEGMACGIPAICTDVASMPEVVEDGVTGFVVPPNDPAALGEKLRWLAANPTEAERMGRAARERVLRHFSWPVVVQRCLEIYTA